MTTSRQELFCVDVDNVRQVVLGAECRKVHIVYEKDWLTSDNESLTDMHDMMTSRHQENDRRPCSYNNNTIMVMNDQYEHEICKYNHPTRTSALLPLTG